MYQTSDGYKRIAYSDGRQWNGKAHIVLKNGTALDVTNADIMSGGIQLESGTSAQGKFTVGGAVISTLIFTLNNFEEKFAAYDFDGAVITPYAGLTVKQHWQEGKTIEWIPLGIFTVDDSATVGSTVQMTAFDNMERFDRPYSESTLKYPATLLQIVQDTCTQCGVEFNNPDFTNFGYTVAKKPDGDSMTFREILSYAAQLAGCFAKITRTGTLVFGWYDFKEVPAEFKWSADYNIATADVTIANVQIVSDSVVYQSGNAGYGVKIESNALAQDGLQALADTLGTKLIGMQFTPYTVTTTGNPAINCGDVVLVTDKKGIVHRSFISSASYTIGENETFSADAETLSENSATRYSAVQKAQQSADKANAGVEEAKTEITQLNGEIQLKVSKGSVIAEINISPENIKISADRLELTGLVTITNLENGTTTVNGACIKTGRVESENGDFWVDLESGEVHMERGTFAGEVRWSKQDYISKESFGLYIHSDDHLFLDADRIILNSMTDGETDINGDVHFLGRIYSDGQRGYSGNVRIPQDDGGDIKLEFRNGLLVDYEEG